MNNVVLMDFMAEWCGPCKIQDPILEDLKKKFEGRVDFKKIDVDKDGEIANKYGIRAVPTLVIEKNGSVLKKYVGVTSKSILEKDLEKALI
jgi:thioredoxin 1